MNKRRPCKRVCFESCIQVRERAARQRKIMGMKRERGSEFGKRGSALHHQVVGVTLPQFAEKLKEENVISEYHRNTFQIRLDRSSEVFESARELKIKPDLVMTLPDKKNFLVEIVNPREPKRLMGELACIQLLGFHHLVDAAMVFLLPLGVESVEAPAKGMRLWQGGQVADEAVKNCIPSSIASWSTREDFNYSNLKSWIMSRQPSWWFK